jgi:hypothetical protein
MRPQRDRTSFLRICDNWSSGVADKMRVRKRVSSLLPWSWLGPQLLSRNACMLVRIGKPWPASFFLRGLA